MTDQWELKHLQVRVIQPDGPITENPVAPVETQIVRCRGYKVSAVTLALPGIQPETIIEYQHDIEWNRFFVLADSWMVPEDLFTLRSTFVRRPSRLLNFGWFGSHLPPGVQPALGPDGLIHMELTNVPSAEPEEFMLPEAETRPRASLYYY